MDREDVLPPASGQRLVAGRYELGRSLGNGGMGEVFIATDRTLRRRVALKQLSPALTDEDYARERFFREARVLAKINDPHVVGIFDTGEDDGQPFLVMELIQGTTVQHELDRDGKLPADRARAIGAGTAAGLAAAHAKGVVHRDVKPSNIFLTSDDQPKVGDFGIARLERGDKTLTLAGGAFGSPAYIAPEQAMGERVDSRADLYALGCVLYHMLAGRPPFEGDDPLALTYQHVHAEPAALDTLDAGVSPELSSLVGRLLEKDPADRPASADEVRRALEVTGDSLTQPLPARVTATTAPLPEMPPDEERKRRWPILAIAGAAILLTALMAFAFTRWGADNNPARKSPAARTSPSAATTSSVTTTTSAPSSTSEPPTQQPSTPEAAAAALLALASDMEASGAIDNHIAKEVEHTVQEVLDHLDEPDETQKAVDDLRQKLADDVSKGKVTEEDAQRLSDAVDRFATAAFQGEPEGD
jgi:serine/threonine-protein kinase